MTEVDLATKTVSTTQGQYRFRHLVSSAPFPALMQLCGQPVEQKRLSWNQVLVFNLGFDGKGPRDVHWVYFPDRTLPFYRVGFYDNIFESERMSLYVELGSPHGTKLDVPALRQAVLAGLRREGIVTSQEVVAEHSVVMDPAYVHITGESTAEVAEARQRLGRVGVHSIGRYGGWTYCSIEDNIVEARQVVAALRR